MRYSSIRSAAVAAAVSSVASALPAFGQSTTIFKMADQWGTIQPAGPRTGTNGVNFWNAEGANNGANSSTAPFRYFIGDVKSDFDAQYGAGNWTITGINIAFGQSNSSFTRPGGVSVYWFSNDSLDITNGANASGGVQPGQFAAAGYAASPLRFSNGANILNTVTGSATDVNAIFGNVSLVDRYQFTSSGTATNLVDVLANKTDGNYVVADPAGEDVLTASPNYNVAPPIAGDTLSGFQASAGNVQSNLNIAPIVADIMSGDSALSFILVPDAGTAATYEGDPFGGKYPSRIYITASPNAATPATDVTWTGSAGNAWDHSAQNFTNNSGGAPASFADGATVSFTGGGLGDVNLSGSLQPASIVFAFDSGSYDLQGGGSIDGTGTLTKSGSGLLTIHTFNSYSGGTRILGGEVQITTGSALGTGPIVNNALLTFVPGDDITFANAISGSGALNIVGPATTTLSGQLTYTGDTRVAGCALVVASPLRPVTGSLSVDGDSSSAELAAPANGSSSAVAGEFATVSATNGGLVSVAATGRSSVKQAVLIANSIVVSGGSGGPDGKVDLADNDAVVHSMSATDVSALVAEGLAGNGGLVSSSAVAGLTTLGVISNADGAGGALYSTFDGLPISAGDTLVKYTYVGDTDLGGTVDSETLANLLAGLNGGLHGWENGDLNYDGIVNAVDLDLLLGGLRGQGSPLGGGPGGTGSAVPEPAAMGWAAAGLAMLGCGRRRRQ